ncbi:hypothetical protein [Phyllobacterium meliloti]|uniref:hypothetical protein n=1 Tax=Phyllobacterium meliloti TaxID=555317 RepID=UPI001D157BF9|nr:hypothetical protein [Phyllobacterium sp. T1293]UGX87135.1 hypothetical protein LLE53_004620 [Phyllobacterium sp. T1293]
MSAPNKDGKIDIAPQAALNEYAALKSFYENRTLVLAQQIHELTGTVEALRLDLEAATKPAPKVIK